MINCKEYIFSSMGTRGKGTPKSLCRTITQIFDKEGNLLAENDPNGNYTMEDMYAFAEKYAKNPCNIDEWKNTNQ